MEALRTLFGVSCSVENCEKDRITYPSYRGLCFKHYARWKRHGDPLYARQSFDLEERLFALIDASGDCWLWTGNINEFGYGQVTADGRFQGAHRVVWEWLVGPIPEGLTLDHLCRIRACVNPDHLEPVSRGENVKRAITGRRKALCIRGHDDWIEYGTQGNRYCRTCRLNQRSARSAVVATLVLAFCLLGQPVNAIEECPPDKIHYSVLCLTAEQFEAMWNPPPPPPSSPVSGVEQWRAMVEKYFPPWEVDEALRVIGCETGWTFDPWSKNKWSGASGLFQHMPRYWAERSAKAGWAGYSIFHPEANVAVAAWLWGQTGTWQHWSCKP